jgi:hypothetical protein
VDQGCQMVFFHTKNPNLDKFRRVLDWKLLIYLMAILNILQTFGIFYDHLVQFVFIWYIFSGFGIMYQEKYGNPGVHVCQCAFGHNYAIISLRMCDNFRSRFICSQKCHLGWCRQRGLKFCPKIRRVFESDFGSEMKRLAGQKWNTIFRKSKNFSLKSIHLGQKFMSSKRFFLSEFESFVQGSGCSFTDRQKV